MKLIRVELQILSPPATPWHSDTLFGHICWQVAQRGGDGAIREFLNPFINGEPPFVLSDGFPGGFLPMPLLGEIDYSSLSGYAETKNRKNAQYISIQDFLKLRTEPKTIPIDTNRSWEKKTIIRNQVDRNKGTAIKEELFSTDVIVSSIDSDNKVDVYLLCQSLWEQKAIGLIKQVAEIGYGKDKSSGCGHFRLLGCFEADHLLKSDTAKGFVTLSTYVPKQSDPTEGRWRLRIKYGKLGEGAGNGNPFKRPLLQIEPGAFFAANHIRSYYGRMVQNIAPSFPQAVQCGYTIALPI